MKKLIATFSIGLIASTAQLGAVEAIYSSAKPYVPINFTPEEKRQHLDEVDFIVAEASRCMKEALAHHSSFHRQYGISPFYGDRSSYGKLAWAERKDFLADLGIRLNRNFPSNMVEKIKPFSCVGLALKCLDRGFKALGADETWKKVSEYTRNYGQTGLALQHALQQLGWTSVYWNPDTSRNEEFDEIDKRKFPENQGNYWGHHKYTYEVNVLRHGRYYFNEVDNHTFLTDFDKRPPASFNDIPFFLGVANLGYHVFLGYNGTIIEGHSTRRLTDYQTIETSPFNPLQRGGGPRGSYFSGLMIMPPGYVDAVYNGSSSNRRVVRDNGRLNNGRRVVRRNNRGSVIYLSEPARNGSDDERLWWE